MKKRVKLEINQLHPTQVTVGTLEVEEKRKHFQSLSGDGLRRAIKALPMPAVLGSDGKHFIVDHHHLGRALWDAQIEYAYVDVLCDLSKFVTEAFWSEMALRRLVQPYDEQGILHGIAAIPGHVSDSALEHTISVCCGRASGRISCEEP